MNSHIQHAIESWQRLAARPELVGKRFVFRNGVSGSNEEGRIKSIRVEGDRFTIESDELKEAHSKGRSMAPNLSFKIDEERDIHGSGNTLFCDLDDDSRQIQIFLVD